MAKRLFLLTRDQTAALRQAERRTKDAPTRTRYQAVRLYGSGYQVPHVLEITHCSRTSLMDWCRRYRTAGIAGLIDGRIGGNRAKLTQEQRQSVQAKLYQYTPRHLFGPHTATADGQFWTVPDLARRASVGGRHLGQPHVVCRALRRLRFHVSASPEGVQVPPRGRGGHLPRTVRKKLIDIAQDRPETVLLAEDEAALYLQATLHRVWAPRGHAPVVRADAGRAKTSFYGTLNLHTGQVHAMQARTLTADTTAAHLKQLLTAHPNVPSLLLWDRAPWHRGTAIRAVLAAHPRLEILPLPVAAPDLNPQEQVWKATRQAVSHNHTMLTLGSLAAQFETHLTQTHFATSFLEHRGFYALCTGSNY